MNQEEQARKMQKIIAKAWMDEDFKKRLLSEPAEVFREEGMPTPAGVEVRVVENTDSLYHFVLPRKPDAAVEAIEVGGRLVGNYKGFSGWFNL